MPTEENFSSVLTSFLAYLRIRRYASTTVYSYKLHLQEFFEFLREKGVLDVKRVGKETLKAYHTYVFQSRTKEGKSYSWSTGALRIRVLKRLFEWLEETQQILYNPASGFTEPKRGSRLPRTVLNEQQMLKLLEQPNLSDPFGIRDRAVMEVLYSTGIRLGELVRLALLDCDLQGGYVRVNEGKGGKDRVVPMGGVAIRYLKEYLSKVRPELSQRYNGSRLLKKGNCPSDRVFLARAGRPISGIMIQRQIKKYTEQAGLGVTVTPHVFRHSFATQLVRNGAEIQAVAKMLGHKHLIVTQRYARVAGVDIKKTHQETHPCEKEDLAEASKVPKITKMREPYRYGGV